MDLQAIKYHRCTRNHGEGILLVDIESESHPYLDKHGQWQYYCLAGQHIFSIDKYAIDTPDHQHTSETVYKPA